MFKNMTIGLVSLTLQPQLNLEAPHVSSMARIGIALNDQQFGARLKPMVEPRPLSPLTKRNGMSGDTGKKTVWPICKTTEVEVGCYNWESHSLVMDEGKEEKGYAHVEEWV